MAAGGSNLGFTLQRRCRRPRSVVGHPDVALPQPGQLDSRRRDRLYPGRRFLGDEPDVLGRARGPADRDRALPLPRGRQPRCRLPPVSHFRGQGHGTRMVEWAPASLHDDSQAPSAGETRVDNIAMRRVFERCGWTRRPIPPVVADRGRRLTDSSATHPSDHWLVANGSRGWRSRTGTRRPRATAGFRARENHPRP